MTQQSLFSEFRLTEEDFARFKGQKAVILSVLQDGRPHSVDELELASRSDRVAGRISELRNWYVIDTQRRGAKGRAWYTLSGRRTTPRSLMQRHCPTCECAIASGGITGGKGELD